MGHPQKLRLNFEVNRSSGIILPGNASIVETTERKVGHPPKTLVVRILSLLALFWLAILNTRFPVLRFTSSRLNFLFIVMIFFVPWIALTMALASPDWKRPWPRITLLVLLVPTLVFTIPAGIAALFLEGGGEQLTSVEMPGYRVAAYRENCGAPCGFSVEIQQERTLIPPVMLVRHLRWFDEADEAQLEVASTDQIRIVATGFNSKDPEHPKRQMDLISLRRFMYF
jgi:hypothetical protein